MYQLYFMISKYFYSIKISLYSIEYVLMISTSFHDIKIEFCSVKTNLGSIEYIFIITNFLIYIKIYFYSVKTNLCPVRNIFIMYIFFHWSKRFFSFINFPLNTFLVSISGLLFILTKVRVLLWVCKLNSSTRMWESC